MCAAGVYCGNTCQLYHNHDLWYYFKQEPIKFKNCASGAKGTIFMSEPGITMDSQGRLQCQELANDSKELSGTAPHRMFGPSVAFLVQHSGGGKQKQLQPPIELLYTLILSK